MKPSDKAEKKRAKDQPCARCKIAERTSYGPYCAPCQSAKVLAWLYADPQRYEAVKQRGRNYYAANREIINAKTKARRQAQRDAKKQQAQGSRTA